MHNEGHDGAYQEDDEQNLRDAGGTGGDSTETKYSSDKRDDQEDYSVVKHIDPSQFRRALARCSVLCSKGTVTEYQSNL
jgi:hypothetical protein